MSETAIPKKHNTAISTRDKIKSSHSVKHVEELMAKAKTYEFAKPATLRRINDTGYRRIAYLESKQKKDK